MLTKGYSKLQNVSKGFLDRVGPSILSRNTLFTFCSLLYILYRGTGSVDLGDTLGVGGSGGREAQ